MNLPPKEIAVWYWPVELFAPAKTLGINSLVGCPVDTKMAPAAYAAVADLWCKSTVPAGHTFWIQSDLSNLGQTWLSWVNMPNCKGVFLMPDEPQGGGNATPAQMQAIATGIRKLTNKPLLLDLDGAALIFQPDDTILKGYLDCCDAVSADYYAANRSFDRGDVFTNGRTIDRIRRLAPNKKIYGVPECNDQGLKCSGYFPNGRGPTPAELTVILADLAAHNVDGIIYFADTFGMNKDGYGWQSFGFDAITPECRAVMRDFAATVAPPVAPVQPLPVQPASDPFGRATITLTISIDGKTRVFNVK